MNGEIKWLTKSVKKEKKPKEYYKYQFKRIIEQIDRNKKPVNIIVSCPVCGNKNSSLNKFCLKCGVKIEYNVENYL